MDHERVVVSIVALLFLFIAIRKAQRFRFLTLYLVFALLATRIKRLQGRRRRRGALLSKTEASGVGYIRDHKDGLKKCIEIRSCFRCGKMTFLKSQKSTRTDSYLKRLCKSTIIYWAHEKIQLSHEMLLKIHDKMSPR